MWSATPQGALKAAGATLAKPVADGAEIQLTVGGRYPLHVHINKLNQVDRVRAWVPNDVFGDMLIETTYSGYRNFNGLQFPARIQQSQGGHPTVDLTVTGVEINQHVDISVPADVRNAAAPAAPTANTEKVADGIFWITGSHHSLAVDMGDHVVVIEAPQNERVRMRSLPRRRSCFPTSRSGWSSTRICTSITPADCAAMSPRMRPW